MNRLYRKIVLWVSLLVVAYGQGNLFADIGQVSYFLISCPSLYHELDGALVCEDDANTCATGWPAKSLFNAMGGAANWPVSWTVVSYGHNYYYLPEARGMFIRSFDHEYGRDLNRVYGSTQIDSFQGHWHNSVQYDPPIGYISPGATWGAYGLRQKTAVQTENTTFWGVGNPVSDGTHGTPRINSETRPVNLALYTCVQVSSVSYSTSTSSGGGDYMVSTFTLVAVTTQASADMNPGPWKDFTGADISFWYGLFIASIIIAGFKFGRSS